MKEKIGMCLLSFSLSASLAQSSPNPESPHAPAAPDRSAFILTPPAPEVPLVHGARIFGVRPGSRFLYTIAATGRRPMTFSADGLPPGLTLDPTTGNIRGSLDKKGEYVLTLKAKNELGEATRPLRIVVGDKIALTPPMGWNSWNCWGGAVSQEKVLSSARAMVAKGLQNHGWSFINIDDGWQGKRGGAYNAIQPNEKFPDIKGLADEIHSLGLKFGIYSSPWRGTYEGHIGSSADREDGIYEWIAQGDHNEFYRVSKDEGEAQRDEKRRSNWHHGRYSFVERDVRQWNDWGVDYLKYDWYPNDVPHVEEIQKALRAQPRDVVLSLSNNAPYEEASEWARLANAWRTTGDINDTWAKVCNIGFIQDRWAPYAGPGHWNDPDMLVVGHVGWGPKLHLSRLTPDEQYSHVSLWCLLAAPLMIGCDIAQMDDFTLSLLTNDEVLEINQDPLGKQATRVWSEDERPVYAKHMEDGSLAVGLFNRSEKELTAWCRWSDMGLFGKQKVRDLWRQKDLGVFEERFETKVPPHGVILVRMSPAL